MKYEKIYPFDWGIYMMIVMTYFFGFIAGRNNFWVGFIGIIILATP